MTQWFITQYSKWPGYNSKLLGIENTRKIWPILKRKDNEVNLEITQMLELLENDFKTTLTTTLHEVKVNNLKMESSKLSA